MKKISCNKKNNSYNEVAIEYNAKTYKEGKK